MVANLVEANLLVILTDQQGIYDCDPRQNPAAKLLHEVAADDPELERVAGGGGGLLGRGGMITKVRAAARAARSGPARSIVSGRQPDILRRVSEGDTCRYVVHARARPDCGTQTMVGQPHVSARGIAPGRGRGERYCANQAAVCCRWA